MYEEQEGELKRILGLEGVDYKRGHEDSSFCTFNHEVYAFKKEVYKFSFESTKWELYHTGG